MYGIILKRKAVDYNIHRGVSDPSPVVLHNLCWFRIIISKYMTIGIDNNFVAIYHIYPAFFDQMIAAIFP
jgi:hypothetical protein